VGEARPQGWFLAHGIMAITGVAAAAALVVVVLSAISERPIPGLGSAVVPAVAVLAVGQLWVITALNRRQPALGRRIRPLGFGEARELFFSPLPRHIVLGVLAVFALGWLSAATAVPFLANGVPSTGTPACPYTADDHGAMICISKVTYLRAAAADERAAAGVMLGFFIADFGVALSEVRRSREARPRAGGHRSSGG
jgi:hypothetical protein